MSILLGFSGLSRFVRNLTLGGLASRTGNKKISFMVAKSNAKDLVVLKELIESGKVRPMVDRTYTMSETPEAVRYVEGPKHKPGHARGKVVITID